MTRILYGFCDKSDEKYGIINFFITEHTIILIYPDSFSSDDLDDLSFDEK